MNKTLARSRPRALIFSRPGYGGGKGGGDGGVRRGRAPPGTRGRPSRLRRRTRRRALAGEEVAGEGDRIGEARTSKLDALGKGARQPRGHGAIQKHEDAAIVGAPDQAAEGLFEAQPRDGVVVI